MSKSVLIVDDDPAFRSLVASLLKSRGFRTVEASNTNEATSLYSKDTVLAIVDYRLPGDTGLNWITNLRDAGRNIPVVFVSATPCDQSTFNWLRNILRVSLIVKKPIIPEVFLQQVESLLPQDIKDALTIDEGVASLELEPNYDEDSADQTALLKQLSQLGTKLETRAAIQIAQANYTNELSQRWSNLAKNVNELRQNTGDFSLLSETITSAHSLAGTAGSLGLAEVGAAGAKLEKFLHFVDSEGESTDQEVVWSEIFRILADGEKFVGQALGRQKQVSVASAAVTKILLVGEEAKYKELVSDIEGAHIELTESAAGVKQKLKRSRYDALIVDFNSAHQDLLFDVIRDVRSASRAPIPVAIVERPGTQLDDDRLTYLGCSERLPPQVSKNGLTTAIETLLTIGKSQKHRVLIVDDDDVLCQFVATILTANGFEVRTLNFPMLAAEVIEEFDPDILLLDVIMPGLTGYEVCRNIREDGRYNNLPILFLTGKTSPESRSAAFQAGANDFLTKPVLTEELLTRISAQLDRVSRESERLAKDPMTNLLTQDSFIKNATEMLVGAGGKDMTLILLTIDDVENLRIVQGVEALKQAIGTVGELMLTHFTAGDFRGRLGYEGFMLLMPDGDKQSVLGAIELLQSDLASFRFMGSQGSFVATFSAGIADTTCDGSSFHELLQAAHRRMVAAKRERSGLINVAG